MNDHEDTNGRHENEVVNDDDDSDDEESVVPTADEVELEYTYPDNFPDRSFGAWRTVVRRFFRLIIDPSCTAIPDHVFRMCTLLIEIVFPDNSSLTRIGVSAFCDCHNLQRINAFPEGMIEFGASAFADCRSLGGEITISRNVRYVRDNCFAGCKAITSVVFDTDPTTTTAAVANPNSVVELGDYMFYCCYELRSVRLPYNLIAIPPFCFSKCAKLTNVPIPVPVRVIGRFAFAYCSSLTSVYLSESVGTICKFCFANCTSLQCITIRSSNVRFKSYVFDCCTGLSSIKVLPTVWPKLFKAMNHPNFIYKFVREYHYQIARLIEWKHNPLVANSTRPSTLSSSSLSGLSTQEDTRIRNDEGIKVTKRPRLEYKTTTTIRQEIEIEDHGIVQEPLPSFVEGQGERSCCMS